MDEYKKIPKKLEPVYALGHIGPGMLSQFIMLWVMKYYLTGNYLTGAMIGWVMMSGRIMDGVSDPLIANWSDNIRSKKYGRRIPFIMIGMIPMIISFIMIWKVPSASNMIINFIWLFIWVNLFYLSYTAVVNPYLALLPDITKDEGDRARIQSYVAFFGVIGMGIAMGLSGILIQAMGYNKTAITLSVICAAVLFAPFLTVKTNEEYVDNNKEKKKSVFENLKGALSDYNFRSYLAGFGLFYFGFNLVQCGLAFIAGSLLGLKEGATSTMMIASVAVALCFIPLYQRIIKKRGSKFALRLAVASYVVVALLILFFTAPILPFSPMVRGIVMMVFMGFPYSGLMVVPNVLVSGIIDIDYAKHGVRREALFFGTQGLINKCIIALSTLTTGYVLDLLGSTSANPLGVKILGPIASVCSVLGFLMLNKMNSETENLNKTLSVK